MSYIFLTGGTGLLGRYLLGDLLRTGQRVAVLVRPNRRYSARQRVEEALSDWDELHGTPLPRPVVLSGDINQPNCGLDEDALQWLATNCDHVLHCAASLSFVDDPKTGEPNRSNIGGVENVLSVCSRLQRPHLTHISTAYVCGRTQQVFREDQLDIGQEFANPYEASKAQAERLVRSADGLSGYTIFRPSIITGDSKTGFASTYHGFYAPLRVLQAMMSQAGSSDALSKVNFLAALGLDGSERKNFVTVDWVSDAIVKILNRQRSVNQTYALVSENPMKVLDLHDAFADAIDEHCATQPTREKQTAHAGWASPEGSDVIAKEFRTHFAVYESYWRDDCAFDCRNAKRLLADTPCPHFDRSLAMLLTKAALDANFGFPTPAPTPVDFCVDAWLESSLSRVPVSPSSRNPLTVRCLGSGGGVWTLHQGTGKDVHYSDGNSQGSLASELVLTTSTLRALVSGQCSIERCFESGLAYANHDQASSLAAEYFGNNDQLHPSASLAMSTLND